MKNIFQLGLWILIITIVIFTGCTDETSSSSDKEAEQLTIEQLRKSPGYAWFDVEYNQYIPDTNVIKVIKDSLKNNQRDYLIFVNPTCACTGTQKVFPALIKVLNQCGIYEPQFKVYSMLKAENKHPYMSMMKINVLPAAFMLRNGAAACSIVDTFNTLNSTANKQTIEQCLLNGIRY